MRIRIVLTVLLATTACSKEKKVPAAETAPATETASAAPPAAAAVVATGATPEQAFANYQQALVAKDLDFLWSFVSNKDKADRMGRVLAAMNGRNVPAARMAEFAEGFGKTPDEIRKMSKPDFDKHFIWMVVGRAAFLIKDQKIENVALDGDTAILTMDLPKGSKLAMVKEDGNWHFDMAGTSAANGK